MTTRRYAQDTQVSTNRSRDEIERTLSRYGASQFMYGWEHGRAVIAFAADDRRVQFMLPMPDREDPAFTRTPTGKKRAAAAAEQAYEQAVRQAWRALALVIKAKLEAVAAGITEFEAEFLAHIMLPDGSTVGDWARPQLAAAYTSGAMPALMPGGE